MTKAALDAAALDQLFREARTFNAWSDRSVAQETLKAIYDLARMGPTSANVCPGRFVFVSSAAGKALLLPHVSSSNRAKTAAAPVCVIMAYDLDFAQQIPFLMPHNPGAAAWFADPAVQAETAMRSGTLQAGYFMLAARALGLDCGPMSGFDKDGVDAAFFAGTRWRTNFLCNLGYGDPAGNFARLPRLDFETACRTA
jgi:3-hydroxypropanoate dehydrogenase